MPELGRPANDTSGAVGTTAPISNMFITRGFDWSDGDRGARHLANQILGRLGLAARVYAPGSTGYQTSVEQRSNIYHFVSQVLAYQVDGALIELGSFTGQIATLIARIVAAEGCGQELHVYDTFGAAFGSADPLGELKRNFESLELPLPTIHAGLFNLLCTQASLWPNEQDP